MIFYRQILRRLFEPFIISGILAPILRVFFLYITPPFAMYFSAIRLVCIMFLDNVILSLDQTHILGYISEERLIVIIVTYIFIFLGCAPHFKGGERTNDKL